MAEGTKAKPFNHTGPLTDCNGCMKCNMCHYRKQNTLPDPNKQKTMNASMAKQREKYEEKSVKEYVAEMREIGKALMQAEDAEEG